MKKKFQKLILLLCISFFVSGLKAQVTVTGSTAADGPYTTLGAAFTAINGAAQTGNSIVISLTAGTTETTTATLNAGAWTSVSITATVPVIITGNVGGAIIRLNGADFVTIDGRIGGLGRNITVINTSTAASAAIWLSSVGVGAGATNNVIRNLEISCGVTQNTATTNTFGIIMCGATISTTSNGDDNDNNTFTENRIVRCRYGIVTRGVTTNNNVNIQVTNNIIGPNSFGTDEIGKAGIFMQADFQSAVTGNTVQFVGGDYANTSGGTDRVGIAIGVDAWSNSPGTITSSFYLVSNNLVHDIIEERTNSAIGILLGTTNGGSPTSNIVSNNMIYNVKANGTFGDALVGIGISGGNSDQVIHNSIYLYGDVDPNASATATSMYGSGIRIANANSASHANLILRYNNIHMDLTSSSTPAARYYAISGNSAAYSFGTGGENYNNYYLNPSNPQLMTGGLGSSSGNTLGTQFATLLNWKTAYTVNQDANSIQTTSSFTSTTNLHIPIGTNSLLESGALGSALTLDYDGDTRPGPTGSVNGGGTFPDIGADEFDGVPIPSCSGSPAIANSLAVPSAVCSGVNFDLSLDITFTELGYTYQWESSTDDVSYSPISGATNATLSTTQTAATYYHCIITCTNSGLSTTSASVQVNMNLPTACYCTPAFSNAVEPITLVNFVGINNSTSPTVNGTPALEDFTAMTANVTQGMSYPITLKGNTDGNYTNYMNVFIDFNQNGSFADAGESFNIGTITNSTGIDAVQATGNITIPFTSTAGITRMRVMKLFSGYSTSCNATGFGQAEDYTIDITAAINCTGTPTAGSISTASLNVCSGTNVTLNLTGQSTDANITIQWESSPDGVTYTPISGANGTSYSTTISAVTYFQCVLTCTSSGQSSTTASVQFSINPFTACYCIPTFSNAVEPITLVNFAGINNSTSATVNGTPALEDFTAMTANVTQGMSYPITLKGNTDGNYTNYMNVFIDFNQNGSFADAGESFNIGTITNSTGIDAIQATGNITIPFTSTPGVTRMRVMKLFSGYSASCNTTGFGQAEDYSIDITAAVNCTGTPTPGTISTASLNVCPSTNVTLNLTGQSSDANITLQWESSSDGVSYTPIVGANGTSYSTTITTVTYFQCVVTCTSSGLSATTTPVQFNINPFTSCYCAVTFPSNVEPITLVNFAGINNTTSATLNGTPAQENFTSITATVNKGQSYPITLKGNTDGNFTNYLTVYIDFNQNGSYADLGENFEIGTITNSTGVDAIQLLGNISIPMTATTGITGMRVIKKFNSIALPCNAAGFGQAEDYTIDIQPCVPPSSIVLVSGDADATICPNTSVTFTAPTGLSYYDFQVNAISVQSGVTNTYTNFSLANNDVVTVIAGYDATCATSSNSFTITHHAVPAANTIGTDALCNGVANGAVDLTVTGGTPSYNYIWSNGATTEDLTAVVAGTYSVVVIDVNGCSGNSTISISEPSAISVSVSSVDVSCFSLNDGSINITVSGGTSPYTFDWDNDGTGDFDDTEDLSSLIAGVYTGVVMDDNGCTDGGSITISEPALLVANAVVSNITCFGLTNGSIDITVSGGTSPYTFDWDNDGTGDFNDTEDLSSLSSGSYNLVVEDANGCTAISPSTITEPAVLSASVTATDITCNGLTDGNLNLTVTGGTTPYSFDWDNDGTGDFNDTEDISGLATGTYNVVIMDANFCGSVSGGTIAEPTAFTVNVTSIDASCFGLSDGSFDLTISGATPPYTFDWDNDGTGDFNDTEDLSSIPAGNYVGVVMDANGCTDGGTITINEPTEIIAAISVTDITCNGSTDGEIDLTISGGSGVYTIDWDNDATGDFDDTEDLSGLSAGIYTVVVMDNTNCSGTNFDTIVEPSIISVSATNTDITCNGLTDGEIDITVSGGTSPFTFDWDNDGTGDFDDTEDLTSLAAGAFTVVVNDANGCPSASTNATVNEPSILSISSSITNANCDNSSDGEIDLTITGGTGAYDILWSTTATTEDLTGLADGSYSVTVTDDNGCTANSNETVGFDNTSPVVTLTVTPAIICNTASAMNLGGESPTGGNWSGTGVTGSSFDPSVAGIGTFNITYTFTDGNGCTNSAQDDIQVDDCSSITENSETGFSVYPNPSLGMFNINTTSEKGNIIVHDAIGKVVYSSTFNTSKISLDLSSMARGVYYITLETSEGNMIQKIVKD